MKYSWFRILNFPCFLYLSRSRPLKSLKTIYLFTPWYKHDVAKKHQEQGVYKYVCTYLISSVDNQSPVYVIVCDYNKSRLPP